MWDPTKELLPITVTIWFTAFTEISSAIFISASYAQLIFSVKRSEKKVGNISTRKYSKVSLVAQMLIFICSSFLCWLVSNLPVCSWGGTPWGSSSGPQLQCCPSMPSQTPLFSQCWKPGKYANLNQNEHNIRSHFQIKNGLSCVLG